MIGMKDDPSLAMVSVPEEFRRAKRYSLTWSALTVLACLGEEIVSATSNSTPGIFPLGLDFTKSKIIGAAWLCAVFMVFGYARAHRLLRLLNSKFLKSRNIETTFEQADELERVVSSSVSEIQTAANGADQWLSRTKNTYSAVEAQLRSIASDILKDDSSLSLNNLPALLMSPMAMKDDSNSLLNREAQWTEHFKRMKALTSDRNTELAKTINDILDNTSQTIESRESQIREDLNERLEKISSNTSSLGRLSEDLRAYHDAIGAADRRWVLWHDHVPTYGLFVMASLFGLYAFVKAFC